MGFFTAVFAAVCTAFEIVTAPVTLVASGVCVASGFVIAHTFKNKIVESKNLVGGVVQKDTFTVTNPTARNIAKWTTLFLSEYLMSHKSLCGTEFWHDGKFLGNTRTEAASKANELGVAFMNDREFCKAKNCFAAAQALSSESTEDEKRTIQINRSNVEAEIHNEEGEKYMRKNNFEKAIESFNRAYELSAVDEQKTIFLINKNNAAAEFHNKKGEQYMEEEEFEEALNSFAAALGLSTDNSQKENFRINKANADAELIYKRGQEILKQVVLGEERYLTARASFIQALDTCSTNYKNKSKFQKSKDETEVIINQISAKIFQEGKNLWQIAWRDEEDEHNDNSIKAEADFAEAKVKFERALALVENDSKFEKYVLAACCKVEGNDLYNRSLDVFESANEDMKNERYQLARRRYEIAQELSAKAVIKFKKGFEAVEDEKFNDCIESMQSYNYSLAENMKRASLFTAKSCINEGSESFHESQSFEVLSLKLVNET